MAKVHGGTCFSTCCPRYGDWFFDLSPAGITEDDRIAFFKPFALVCMGKRIGQLLALCESFLCSARLSAAVGEAESTKSQVGCYDRTIGNERNEPPPEAPQPFT